MLRQALWGALGVGFAALLGTTAAQAQDGGTFDDPETETGPCIVLNNYDVSPIANEGGGTAYRGLATLENTCGRAMEVFFCFVLAATEQDSKCFVGPVRPWDRFYVEDPAAPARIVAVEYEWRYLPVAEG